MSTRRSVNGPGARCVLIERTQIHAQTENFPHMCAAMHMSYPGLFLSQPSGKPRSPRSPVNCFRARATQDPTLHPAYSSHILAKRQPYRQHQTFTPNVMPGQCPASGQEGAKEPREYLLSSSTDRKCKLAPARLGYLRKLVMK